LAEASYSTTTRVAVPVIWDFVREMDNWARFVAGYQAHEKRSDTESVWTLKGDLGVMSRTLRFEVRVLEWTGPERVRFALTGRNEPMSGEGSFTLEAAGDASASAAATSPPRRRLVRWLEALWRRLIRRMGGRVEREAAPLHAEGTALARVTFRLRLDPGGPMAPMVNAMIKPLLLPAAEDLANRILAHLEASPPTAP
jgi:carbon monoxide dehydrogenase subunit G